MKSSTRRMQPLVAIKAIKRLIANPDNTEEVFAIIRAMSGDSLFRAFDRFKLTETGKRIIKEKRELLETLQNRERLAGNAAGSLGRSYLSFVQSEKITADGLVDASEENVPSELENQSEELIAFGKRMRDQHDLWHVLTGYGRDTFGEVCLLAFTYAQTKNRGLGLIAIVGAFRHYRELGSGVIKAFFGAYMAGKRAAWLPQQDWETMLEQPIDDVRQQLNIPRPKIYQKILEDYALAGT